VEQAEKLRQQKREEQERLKKDKQFSWNQKVGGWVGGKRRVGAVGFGGLWEARTWCDLPGPLGAFVGVTDRPELD
jgi:hypothetical protein